MPPDEKLLEKYQERVQNGEIPIHRGHILNEEDLIIRRHILNLMTRFSTEWQEPGMKTPFLNSVSDRLRELKGDGLVQLGNNRCEVTNEGKAFVRNICMAFDSRLAKKAPDTELFSKTV